MDPVGSRLCRRKLGSRERVYVLRELACRPRLCVGDGGGGGCGGGDGGLCPAGERCLFAVCRLERSAAWVKLKVRIDGTNTWSGRVVSALTKT